MSVTSIHSSFGCSASPVMRVASSRFWISLLSRSDSSRTTLASEASRGSPATAGALHRTVAAPRIDASGVRSSCETEPIKASRKRSDSARMRTSVIACASPIFSIVEAAS